MIYLRKIILLALITLLLTSCTNHNSEFNSNFDLKANVTVKGLEFKARILNDYVSFSSNYLANDVIFYEDYILFDGLEIDFTANKNSAFKICGLVRTVLDKKTKNGVYNDIPFSCEYLKNSDIPSKVIWGNFVIDFE